MKILHLSTSDATGGAAIAAHRLMQAQQTLGLDARMLVAERQTSDASVAGIKPALLWHMAKLGERLEIVAHNRSRRGMWSVDTASLGTRAWKSHLLKDADILHLHWINQGFLSLGALQHIFDLGKPVVWTLHDMWPLTAICHHAQDCTLYLHACASCPLLQRPAPDDLSHKVFLKKQGLYAHAPLTLVACSDWLAAKARESALTGHLRVESITNPIDTAFFQPGSQAEARRALGLPEDMALILFVAQKATNPAKGLAYLLAALAQLFAEGSVNKDKVGVVIAGLEADRAASMLPCKAFPMGYISDPHTTRLLYQACTLLAMPTLMDNLPNTIAEAACAALPTVGFHVGGLPQMIVHGQTGLLARLQDTADLARQLRTALCEAPLEEWGRAAREKALQMYGAERVAQRYLNLYNELLNLPKS